VDQGRKFAQREGDLFEVTLRVLMDSPSCISADAGYLLGQTRDNDDEPLSELLEAWKRDDLDYVLLEDIGTHNLPVGSVVTGFDDWRNRLISMGAQADAIVRVPPALDLLPCCTDAEVIGLVRVAKERGWKSVYLFAPALHRFRAFVSTVSAIRRVGYELLVYSQPQIFVQNWQEIVVHSQSAPRDTRKSQVAGELAKVERYCAKGDHVTAREVLDYLDWRDSQ